MGSDEKPRPRGRPVSGRKTIIQIGLDEEDAEKLRRIADAEKSNLSEAGRRILLEGMSARKPKERRK